MTLSMCTSPIQVGQQRFDGLARRASITVGGRTDRYHYIEDQTPASRATLADGRSIDYDYVHELDEAIKQTKPEGETAIRSTYVPALGLLHTCEGALGRQTRTYTANGHLQSETWAVGSVEHVTQWHHSLRGKSLGFTDANKVEHRSEMDAFGRLSRIETDQTTCLIDYDDFSRPCRYTTTSLTTSNILIESLTYDNLGREHTRTFSTTQDDSSQERVLTLTYNDLDQVRARQWQEGDTTTEEHYRYDACGRLIHYRASRGIARDGFGNCVLEQSYALNFLDGHETVHTQFSDGTSDLATYHYDNADDPCQVSAIDHTHSSWPSRIDLQYDLRGRLISDSLGRTLSWDGHDRVSRVDYQAQSCLYGYDPSGNLCDRSIDTQLARCVYSDGQLTHEQRGEQTYQFMGEVDRVFAISRLAKGVHQGTLLLGCDAQGSVRVEAEEQVSSRHYTAHGAEPSTQVSASNPFGFAGERREPLTGWYIPGGYRPYDPVLMIFLAPDSDSPFGEGGINSYSYCSGDPVNRIDPDGHAWWNWLVAGVSLAIGVVGTVLSLGALAPVLAGGVAAMTASGVLAIGTAAVNVAATITGFAASAMELTGGDTKTANILGYVALGLSVIGGIASIGQKVSQVLDVRKVARYTNGAQNWRIYPGAARPGQVPLSNANNANSGLLSRAPSSSPSSSLRTQPGARMLNSPVERSSAIRGIEMTEFPTSPSRAGASVVTDIAPRPASPAISSDSSASVVTSSLNQAPQNLAAASASRVGILEHTMPSRLFPYTRLLRDFYLRRSL